MKIYTSVDQLIGKTPLLELCRMEKAENLLQQLKESEARLKK